MKIDVAGVVPRDVLSPRTADELADAVRALHAERKTFAFAGGATHLDLGNAPRPLDALIRMSALNGVIEYAPEDQTITVEAGMTLGALDRILAQHGQMLPLDAYDRDRATVGGVVAANVYGRRRQRYGTAKDLIVGVGIVRADGVRARGGGKVVKNVAGFDLPKLMAGSLGTLGAIVHVTFRLYPMPDATRAAVLHLDREAPIVGATDAIAERRLEPESVVLYDYHALVVTFSGTTAGVDEQMRALLGELAPRFTAGAAELTDLEREAYEQRERAVRRDGPWRLHVVTPPAESAATAASGAPAPPITVPVAYPMLGVSFHAFGDAAFAGDAAAPDSHVRDLRDTVAAATNGHGRVVFDAMPNAARPLVDAWGPPPASFALMRRMKANFDPHALCNPGRFVGGL